MKVSKHRARSKREVDLQQEVAAGGAAASTSSPVAAGVAAPTPSPVAAGAAAPTPSPVAAGVATAPSPVAAGVAATPPSPVATPTTWLSKFPFEKDGWKGMVKKERTYTLLQLFYPKKR